MDWGFGIVGNLLKLYRDISDVAKEGAASPRESKMMKQGLINQQSRSSLISILETGLLARRKLSLWTGQESYVFNGIRLLLLGFIPTFCLGGYYRDRTVVSIRRTSWRLASPSRLFSSLVLLDLGLDCLFPNIMKGHKRNVHEPIDLFIFIGAWTLNPDQVSQSDS